ncbi:MAG TPA: PH domain-containing protein, partial [Patescibacteria group bacterium]
VYIVTNERLIAVEFMGLLSKSINVTQIRKIEDVSYSQRGLASSFFDFGDVIAETASEQRTADVAQGEPSSFTFESVGNPNEVVRIISDLMDKEEHEDNNNNDH